MKPNSKRSTAARLAVALVISLVFPALPVLAPPEIVHKPNRGDSPPQKGTLLKLWKSGSIAVTFSTPMVTLDKVSTEERLLEEPCPVVLDPPLDVHWKWVSQTEGELRPPINYTPHESAVPVRRIMYRAKLQKDLRDLAGKAVDPQNWGAQFADDSFALSGVEFLNVVEPPETEGPAKVEKESEESEGPADEADADEEQGDNQPKERSIEDPLPARPRVRLEFSRDVKLGDVAKAVLFEDNASHERFPIEVNVEGAQTDSPQGWVLIEPIKPLPPGRNYLLVMERISSSASGEQLPHQRVLPAGKTNPITIKVVAGYNQPVKGAFIRVRASKPIDPESATPQSIVVDPPVAKLKIDRDVRNGRTIELLGDFDTAKVYKVTLKAGLKSVDQFELEKDSVWTARFSRKRPAIISRQPPFLFQRATAPDILSSFLQVNTGTLEWKIATVPPQKLPEIRERLREFGEPVTDKDGKVATDKTKGEDLWQKTELLIPALRLPSSRPELLMAVMATARRCAK